MFGPGHDCQPGSLLARPSRSLRPAQPRSDRFDVPAHRQHRKKNAMKQQLDLIKGHTQPATVPFPTAKPAIPGRKVPKSPRCHETVGTTVLLDPEKRGFPQNRLVRLDIIAPGYWLRSIFSTISCTSESRKSFTARRKTSSIRVARVSGQLSSGTLNAMASTILPGSDSGLSTIFALATDSALFTQQEPAIEPRLGNAASGPAAWISCTVLRCVLPQLSSLSMTACSCTAPETRLGFKRRPKSGQLIRCKKDRRSWHGPRI